MNRFVHNKNKNYDKFDNLFIFGLINNSNIEYCKYNMVAISFCNLIKMFKFIIFLF